MYRQYHDTEPGGIGVTALTRVPFSSTSHVDEPEQIVYHREECPCGAVSEYPYRCMECGRELPSDGDGTTDGPTESNGEADEDPARFLDTRRFERGELGSGQGSTPAIALAVMRIRGIRSVDVVETWIEYEVELPYGPRSTIMGELYTRKAALQEGDL